MKLALAAFAALVAATASLHPALADEDDADDVVILSVQPRSPDVKPIMQTVTPRTSGERMAAAAAPDPEHDAKLAAAKAQQLKAAERS